MTSQPNLPEFPSDDELADDLDSMPADERNAMIDRIVDASNSARTNIAAALAEFPHMVIVDNITDGISVVHGPFDDAETAMRNIDEIVATYADRGIVTARIGRLHGADKVARS